MTVDNPASAPRIRSYAGVSLNGQTLTSAQPSALADIFGELIAR